MKVKIINLKLYDKTNAIQFSNEKTFIFEKEVFAIAETKKNKFFLIENGHGYPFWIYDNKAIEISDNKIPNNWMFTRKYNDYNKSEYSGVEIKNIFSPKWMIDDETFFYDIIENRDIAAKKFYDNEIKPRRLKAQKDEEEM
ncbi:MAG: hypothetical protein PHR96_03095 [Clostridia bacterium]|nr:hypothetical protein [Clostridia bacterium]